MTRAEAITGLIAERLSRVNLDAPGLKAVVCIVRLRPGGGSPRGVQINLEYEQELPFPPEGPLDSGGRHGGKAV